MLASHAAVALHSARQEANLRIALHTSRTIGEAIGIIMATCKMSEAAAFEQLMHASKNTNTKLRDVAETVTQTGETPRPQARSSPTRVSESKPLPEAVSPLRHV
jgi:AmiR/NasT family two-component response regulator